MSPHCALTTAAVAMLVLPVAEVPADILWDNHLEHNVESGGRAFGGSAWEEWIVADNFSLTEQSRLRKIRFEALRNDDFTLESADIYIYEDLSGGQGREAPTNGRLIGTFDGFGFDTGRTDRNREVWRYTVPFDLTLDPGHYYIGLHINGPGTAIWWATSTGGQGADTFGWFSSDNGDSWTWEGPSGAWDHAFEIHGRVIPAPGGLAILVGVLLITRRRR